MKGLFRSEGPAVSLSYFLIRTVVGFFLRILLVERVEGIERIPKQGGAIIAFNHQSYFDFLCFMAVSPRNVHFLTAEKFYRSFFWKPIMVLTGQIKVDRENRDKRIMHDLIGHHLNEGKLVGIFPEGTRSPDKHEMLYAFTGVAKYALRHGVPVIPVGIRGTHEIMSRNDKRPKLRKIVDIRIGEPVSFAHLSHTKMNKKGYRLLTDRVMLRVADLSGKHYPHVGLLKRPAITKR